jgi:hypothetical protein
MNVVKYSAEQLQQMHKELLHKELPKRLRGISYKLHEVIS